MKVDVCCDCGIEVPAVNHSPKRRCTECRKRYYREYSRHKYKKAITSGKISEYRKTAREYMRTLNQNNPQYRLMTRARSRAAQMGLEFDLSTDDIIIPDVCPVLGTPFKYKTYYTASIDRIDSTKGYTKDNVQVMSHKANAMKNSATNEELIKFAKWVLANVPEG